MKMKQAFVVLLTCALSSALQAKVEQTSFGPNYDLFGGTKKEGRSSLPRRSYAPKKKSLWDYTALEFGAANVVDEYTPALPLLAVERSWLTSKDTTMAVYLSPATISVSAGQIIDRLNRVSVGLGYSYGGPLLLYTKGDKEVKKLIRTPVGATATALAFTQVSLTYDRSFTRNLLVRASFYGYPFANLYNCSLGLSWKF